MTRSVRLLVAALLLLGGCGRGEPSAPDGSGGQGAPPRATASAPGTTASAPSGTATASATPVTTPAPRLLTPADNSGRFTLALGSTTTLRVQDPTAEDPVVDGSAVIVVPVVNVASTSVREWEVRAVASGTSTVTGRDPDYTVTITVR